MQLHYMANASKRSLALLGVGMGISVAAFTKFEYEMNRVRIITSANNTEFSDLKRAAMSLGSTTQFSAISAAEAMAELGKQGLTAKEVIEALRPTVELASDAEIGLATSARLVIGTMRAFGYVGRDLDKIVDIVTKGVLSSSTTVEQLGNAFKYIGPVARSSGQDIETMVTAVDILSNNMIRGEEAGTALRSILIRLQAQPTDTAKALGQLNVQVTDSHHRFKSLQTILAEITQAMHGLGDADRNRIIKQIAGMRATSALTALTLTGTAAFQAMRKELANSAGFAKMLQESQLNTLWGQMKLLTNQAENLAIQFGGYLKPSIVVATRALGGLLVWAGKLSSGFFDSIGSFVAFGAALSTAVISASTLVRFVSAFISPVGIAVTAIGILGTAFLLTAAKGDTLAKKLDSLVPVTEHMFDSMKPYIMKIVELGIVGFANFETAIQNFSDFADMEFTGLALIFERFGNSIKNSTFITTIEWLKEHWSNVIKEMQGDWTDFVKDFLEDPMLAATNRGREIAQNVKSIFTDSTGPMKGDKQERDYAKKLMQRAGNVPNYDREHELLQKMNQPAQPPSAIEEGLLQRYTELSVRLGQTRDKRTQELLSDFLGMAKLAKRREDGMAFERNKVNPARDVGNRELGKPTSGSPFTSLDQLWQKIQGAAVDESLNVAKQSRDHLKRIDKGIADFIVSTRNIRQGRVVVG